MKRQKRKQASTRSAVVTLEFILAAPIVFIAMIAIFEFGFVALTLQVGHAAVIEGTRRGAELYPADYPLDLNGADNDIADQITEVMNEYLNIHKLEIVSTNNGFPDDPDRANAQIVIERESEDPVMRGDLLNFPAGFTCTPAGADLNADEVRVTLCFRLVDPTDPTGVGNPVPDWLSLYGVSLSDCMFEVSSRMTLE